VSLALLPTFTAQDLTQARIVQNSEETSIRISVVWSGESDKLEGAQGKKGGGSKMLDSSGRNGRKRGMMGGCEMFCLNSNCTLSIESLPLWSTFLIMSESQSRPHICSSACCGLNGESRFKLAKQFETRESIIFETKRNDSIAAAPGVKERQSAYLEPPQYIAREETSGRCFQFLACPPSLHSHPLITLQSTCR